MDLNKLLSTKRLIIFDGAMGTMLEQRGAPAGPPSNLEAPETVLEIQRAYVDAGSDVLITNTFCMNLIYVESHGLDIDVAAVNRAGVELARRAAGDSVCVLGGVGLSGQLLEPLGSFTEEQFYEAFAGQARIQAEAGVDAFIIETATDIREALCALKACADNFSLPVIVSMSYSSPRDGGRTMMGNRATDCAAALEAAGATAVGANCGSIDPAQLHVIIESYRSACGIPILAEPNAGKPRLESGRTVYDMPPETFADTIAKPCVVAGATMIGGCCGTTPEHIRTLKSFLSEL